MLCKGGKEIAVKIVAQAIPTLYKWVVFGGGNAVHKNGVLWMSYTEDLGRYMSFRSLESFSV